MPSALTRSRPNRRPRTLKGEQRPMQTQIPVQITSVTAGANDLTIVFNQSVRLNGIPRYLKNGTIAPTAATLSAPNTLVLTYPGLGPVAASFSVPIEDPAIRNSSGGFVTPTTVDV